LVYCFKLLVNRLLSDSKACQGAGVPLVAVLVSVALCFELSALLRKALAFAGKGARN
jgi:hypothetical protein